MRGFRGLRRVRLTVRGKLTAIYTAVFTAGGLLLLAFNYVVVAGSLDVHGLSLARAIPAARTSAPGLTGATPAPAQDAAPMTSSRILPASPSRLLGEYRDAVLSDLVLRSAVALLIVVVLAALAGRLIAGRALARLHRVTETARHLSEHDLSRRLALSGPHDELKDLGDTFDGMLARLQAAFDSQRRFAANASHELRTPLAIQRAAVEVPLTTGQVPPHLLPAMRRVLDAAERSEHLIESLLLLARGDRGLDETRPADLAQAAREAADTLADLAHSHGVRLSTRLGPAPLDGDPVLLNHLARNLIDNAIRYNTDGGRVEVVTAAVGAHVTITVRNTGPRVDADTAAELFTPFRRGDGPRLRHAAGSGLGLSIVRSIATAHGGTAAAVARPGGGLVVTVTLPTRRGPLERPLVRT
ncbi:sensor histidine kinase [Microtetraspora niveoalba]|uniref:sensor histidine kinase n=1 Tax=Microtetraspora niveoalba TaxID=46175 RepID=UPI00082ACCAC|nr:ATP-binding protein [Microtetraspora niveoalba]